MNLSSREHEIFYIVQPGDNLTTIGRKVYGSTQVERLKRLNPHLKNPDLIHPGDILALGFPSRSAVAAPVSKGDLQEMQAVLRTAGTDSIQFTRGAFDVLDYLANAKDGADFLHNLGSQSASLVNAAQPYSTLLQHSEILEVSVVYREIYEARREGISFLQRYQLSMKRTPVLILSVRQNGFYPYAEQLKKVLRLADKIKLGKILAIADVALEGSKVALVASEKGERAAKKQAMESTGKIVVGTLGTAAAGQICAVTLTVGGPWGVAGCALALGVGIWGGQAGGEFLGRLVGDQVLPDLN